MQEKLKIGEILVRTGLIQEAQLRSALGEQARWGGRLGVTLVKLGFLTEEDLVRALGSHFGIPVVRLHGKRIAPETLSLLPPDFAEKHGCMPLFMHWENGMEVLYLGMEDPSDLAVLDDVAFRTGLRVRPVLVGPVEIRDAIGEHYHGGPGPGEPRESAADTVPAPPAGSSPVLPDDTPALPVAPAAPDPAPFPPGTPVAPAAPAYQPVAPPAPSPEEATQVLARGAVPDPSYEQTFEPAASADGLPEIEMDECVDDFEAVLGDDEAMADVADLMASVADAGEQVPDSETSPDLFAPVEEPPVAAPPIPEAPSPAFDVAVPVVETAGPIGEPPTPPVEAAASAAPTPEAVAEPSAPMPAEPFPQAVPPEAVSQAAAPAQAVEAEAPFAEPPAPVPAPLEPISEPATLAPEPAPLAAPEPEPASEPALPGPPVASPPPAEAGSPPVDPNGLTHPGAREGGDRRADPGPAGGGRQVSTRDILRAVTQLLIDNGIFTREEFVQQVESVRTDRRAHD